MKNNVRLDDGDAVPMGDGGFVICQRDEYGVAHTVFVTGADLRQLKAAAGE